MYSSVIGNQTVHTLKYLFISMYNSCTSLLHQSHKYLTLVWNQLCMYVLFKQSRYTLLTCKNRVLPHFSIPPPLLSLQLSTPPVSKNVVHLPPTHGDTSPSVMVSEFSGSEDVETTPTSASSGISPPLAPQQAPALKRVSVDIQKQAAVPETSHDGITII